jgi:hypothetical protein
VNIRKRWEPRPSVLVDGYRVLRAMTREEEFAADPPGWEIPPELGVVKPNKEARWVVICFSTRVRTGET